MIGIVLSTFNGATFLEQQLQSIIDQSVSNWLLLIRDDGSTDDSQGVCARYAAQDSRIVVLPPDRERLGPAHSYGRLLEEAFRRGMSYVFMADQDDIWDSDKMELELQTMREREGAVGAMMPLLVHSDLRLVRADGRPLHPSFFKYQRIVPTAEIPMAVLLAQNFVTACSVLVNRALLAIALPFPSRLAMHDWWLALCAAGSGQILLHPRATVAYRQHSRNAVGARGLLGTFRAVVAQRGRWWRGRFESFVQSVHQSHSLSERLLRTGDARTAMLEMVGAYTTMFVPGVSRLSRLRIVWRLGIAPQRLLRRFLYYARLLLAPPVLAREPDLSK